MSEFDFGSLLEKKKEVQEAPTVKTQKTTKKVLPEKILPTVKDIAKQKIEPKSSFVGGTSEEYKPHGTDIMTAHKLICGKSIREHDGKSTNVALLEGLIKKANEMLKKLKGAGK